MGGVSRLPTGGGREAPFVAYVAHAAYVAHVVCIAHVAYLVCVAYIP